ncbi:MAG: hypothetical protein LBH43_18590 [Treponema sp.]|jgi:hypothetical protein|nr:hypothetical protein [Treponema sp.]
MNLPAANTSAALAMRRRSVWEAADSGILLWRNNFLYFIPFFALPIWIAAFALMLIPEEYRWISFFALWWLKPLFDRLCLHVVAVRFFKDESASPKSFRMLFKGMAGMIFRSLPGDLLWRRLSPNRSAAMPLRLLERPGKKQYKERKKALSSGGLKFCGLLTFIGPIIEAVLLGGEYIFAIVIFELFFQNAFQELYNSVTDISIFAFAAYCFNYIIAESLYVCMGFGIYINSRTEMEGWDIQLLFKKFTGRLNLPVKALLLVLSLFLFSLPLYAEDEPHAEAQAENAAPGEQDPLSETVLVFPEGFLASESVPQKELKEILASDDFGGTRSGWTLRLKNRKEPKPLPKIDYAPWFNKLNETLAVALRAFIVIVIAAFAAFAFVRLRQLKPFGKSLINRGGSVSANPLVTAEDPYACFEKARGFFNQGLLREAWASCLCGAIGACTRYMNIVFPEDATEYDCLEIVRSGSVESVTAGFSELVRNWIFLAYGGKNPPEGSFEKALEFGLSIKDEARKPEARIE